MTRTINRVRPPKQERKNLALLRQLAPKFKIDKRGTYNRRILLDYTFKGYNYMFHATKGWRKRKA